MCENRVSIRSFKIRIFTLVSSSPALRRTADAYFKEISPFLLHLGMFVPTIMGQGTPEQQAEWLPRALDMQIIGTYAQVGTQYNERKRSTKLVSYQLVPV